MTDVTISKHVRLSDDRKVRLPRRMPVISGHGSKWCYVASVERTGGRTIPVLAWVTSLDLMDTRKSTTGDYAKDYVAASERGIAAVEALAFYHAAYRLAIAQGLIDTRDLLDPATAIAVSDAFGGSVSTRMPTTGLDDEALDRFLTLAAHVGRPRRRRSVVRHG